MDIIKRFGVLSGLVLIVLGIICYCLLYTSDAADE